MNCSYRLVWNRTSGVMQVASELAKSHSRGGRSVVGRVAFTLVAPCLFSGAIVQPAWAVTQTVTNLADSADSISELVVTGADSITLTGTNTYTGSTTVNGGNLIIPQGGSAKNTATVVDNGHITVDGAGAALITAISGGTPLLVGSGGTGTLTASNGADVESGGEVNLGQTAGDRGTALVTSGATLKAATSINIGKFGTGNLTISSGGQLLVGSGYFSIADQAGSTGTVLVTGSGSSVTNNGVITLVGNHGSNGMLTIADGATVTTSGLLIANDAGSQGVLNIGAGTGDAAVAAGTLASNTVAFGQGTGTLVFNHTNSGYVFAPVISGTGNLNVLAGMTILTASNIYSGGTTISGGMLQIGNGGTQGSIVGNVVDNATLAFNHSDALTFSGAISGSGTLTQSGTGTLTLAGANTYRGGTTISAGTLQVGNGGTQGSLQGDVVDNDALSFWWGIVAGQSGSTGDRSGVDTLRPGGR